jgi:hypothetical protein
MLLGGPTDRDRSRGKRAWPRRPGARLVLRARQLPGNAPARLAHLYELDYDYDGLLASLIVVHQGRDLSP